tara:strand:- start:300 stop:599 length:300 start_codon:yes stop_codon:yes gene_type:complete
MKYYQSRQELKVDVDFIKSIVIDVDRCSDLVSQLFEQWMYTSPDSPFNDFDQNDVISAKTLVEINKSGVSSEWSGEHIVFEDISPKNNIRSKVYNLRSL